MFKIFKNKPNQLDIAILEARQLKIVASLNVIKLFNSSTGDQSTRETVTSECLDKIAETVNDIVNDFKK